MANRQLDNTNYNTLVWRFLTGGTLFQDLGSAGQILIQPPAGKSELARCILVQTDGKIVVGGGSNDAFFVMRLSVTGSPGPTFGSNGALRSGTVNQQTRITAPAQQTDGLIVGCGWQKDGTVTRNPFLLRLLPFGAGDPTFGTQSVRLLIAEGELNALSLRGDEAIVAAGAYQKAMH